MRRRNRAIAQLVFGLIIVFLGVIFTLDNLGYVDSHDILHYWPALLVVYGIARFQQACSPSDRFWGVVLTLVGGTLLLNRLHILNIDIWNYWPLLLVFIGISIIWKTSARQRNLSRSDSAKPESSDSHVSLVAIMSGYERANNSQDFRGGEINAIMGGVELDLRRAAIKEQGAVLDVFAFWGGISIKVPENWIVVNEAIPIMGGIEDKSYRSGGETAQQLIVRGMVIMGGVEIKN